MKDSTDEILKKIQERIDGKAERYARIASESDTAPHRAPTLRTAPDNNAGAHHSGHVAHTPAMKLTPEQITSDVFVIAPTQIEYIAEHFGNLVADGMNMRAFAPKIRALAESALRDALKNAKKSGKKTTM